MTEYRTSTDCRSLPVRSVVRAYRMEIKLAWFAVVSVFLVLAQASILASAQENCPLWTYSQNEMIRVGQMVANDMVFVGLGGVGVHALNASNGELVWSRIGFSSLRSIAVDNGLVLVASGQDVYALDKRTGAVVWHATGSSASTCVAASDGRVYVGFDDSQVHAFDGQTGSPIWLYTAGGRVISIAAANGTVYVRSARDGLLHALDGASGTKLWVFDAMRTLDLAPVVRAGTVFVASGREIYALRAMTGELVWSHESDAWASSSPALAGAAVLIGLDTKVEVLDNATGELTWSMNLGQDGFGAYPAFAQGVMFLLSRFGPKGGTRPWNTEISAIDLSSQEQIWSYPVGSVQDITGPPVVTDRTVLVGFSYGKEAAGFPIKILAFGVEPGQGVCPVCLGARLGPVVIEPVDVLLEVDDVGEEQNLSVSVHSDGFDGELSFRMYVDWPDSEKVSIDYAAPRETTYMSQFEWGPLGYLESAGTLEATIRFKLGLEKGASIDEPLSARCWVVIIPSDCFSGYFDWDLYWDLRSREERSAVFLVTLLPEGHEDVFGGCTGVGLGSVALTPENLTVRVGEEAELSLSVTSGGLGNLRYEGNISLDWDSLILVEHQTHDTWDAMVEGLDLEYYVDRAPSDPWGYLGFLEAGGAVTKSIRFKILASHDGEGGFSPPTGTIAAWVRVALRPSQCDDWEEQEQAKRYSNWVQLTILPPHPAQAQPQLVWERVQEGMIDEVVGFARSQDGGFVIAGSRRQLQAGGSEEPLPLLLKVDEDGRKVWETVYGVAGTEDRVKSVIGTHDGGTAVTGARQNRQTWTSVGYVMKTDEDGRKEWEATFGFEEVTCIVQCEDQGYLVAGGGPDDRGNWRNSVLRLNQNGSKVWETSYQADQPPRCVAQCVDGGVVLGGTSNLVKFDDDGTKVWQKEYAEEGEAFSIIETEDGFILAGGTGNKGFRWHRSFVLKVSPDGSMLWNRTFSKRLRSVARVERGFAFLSIRDIFVVNDEGDLVWEKELRPGLSPNGVVGDADGGLAVAGVVQGDVCVAKVDGEGDVVWVVVHGDADWLGHVLEDGEGGYVAAGWTQSSGTLSRDPYLLKVDGQGEVVWEKTYGDEEWESVNSIVRSEDGFVLAGSASLPLPDRDTYVFKVDSNGNQLWEKTYGVEGWDDWAECLVGTSDGGFVAAGGVSFENGSDMRVLRINPTGGVVWERTYSFRDWDRVEEMVGSDDGGFLLVGGTHNDGEQSDALVLKIDGEGRLLWERTFGGDWADGANCVLRDDTEGYVIGGYTYSLRPDHQDPYLLALDGNGSLLWESNYWGHGRSLVGIAQCGSEGYMAVGEWKWSGTYLLRINDRGDQTWEDRLEGRPTSVIGTDEGIHVVSGYTSGPRAYLAGFREVVPEGLTLLYAWLLVAITLGWTRVHTSCAEPRGRWRLRSPRACVLCPVGWRRMWLRGGRRCLWPEIAMEMCEPEAA